MKAASASAASGPGMWMLAYFRAARGLDRRRDRTGWELVVDHIVDAALENNKPQPRGCSSVGLLCISLKIGLCRFARLEQVLKLRHCGFWREMSIHAAGVSLKLRLGL